MDRYGALRGSAAGVLLAAALAAAATLASERIGTLLHARAASPVSPVLCALVVAMFWRTVVGLDARMHPGVEWVTHTMLRIGIALVGLRLTFEGVASIATVAAPVVLACIAVATGTTFLMGRALRVSPRLCVLIGAGTAVCGCTAIVATAPVIRAKPAEVGLALSCIVLFGCLGMLVYPWIAHEILSPDRSAAGIFIGTSIHDTSQVVGASLIYA